MFYWVPYLVINPVINNIPWPIRASIFLLSQSDANLRLAPFFPRLQPVFPRLDVFFAAAVHLIRVLKLALLPKCLWCLRSFLFFCIDHVVNQESRCCFLVHFSWKKDVASSVTSQHPQQKWNFLASFLCPRPTRWAVSSLSKTSLSLFQLFVKFALWRY